MSPARKDAPSVEGTAGSYHPQQYRPGHTITDWEPENDLFRESVDKRVGGARVTIISFAGMAVSVVGVINFLPSGGGQGNFWGFLGCFLAAFFFSGIGNGSTFRQIPVIFRSQHLKGLEEGTPAHAKVVKQAETESAAVTGFTSAIAAYGFFFIPAMFANFAVTSSLRCFVGFYVTCIGLCWWFYARKGAESPS
ncbi:hypothetical protein [Streptomyces sp. NPDC048527]|uniref:hypothetical protein n=1 Tax=Streptomyces sp. NPDC048527 TaxID=3365568 RepID=UPI003715A3DF